MLEDIRSPHSVKYSFSEKIVGLIKIEKSVVLFKNFGKQPEAGFFRHDGGKEFADEAYLVTILLFTSLQEMTAYLAQAVIFFLIFFLGVVGNSVVLYVLLRQKGSWSITTTYLFNLAIADTLFVCFLPFWGHYHLNGLDWKFGTPMCKAAGTMTYINMYASIFFLTAMSADRWMAIVHATRMNQHRNSLYTRRICIFIWFVSLITCLPSIIFRKVLHQPVYGCRPEETNTTFGVNQTAAYVERTDVCMFFIPSNVSGKRNIMGAIQFFRSVIGFILPLCTICFCYIQIVRTVKRKVINRRVRKDKVAKLAGFVIGAFIFCWTPYHIINLYSALGGWWGLFSPDSCFYYTVKPFTVCLAYANSCINPIVYAFTTTKFQENMRDICAADKSPRPYRMVLTTRNDDKSGKDPNLTLKAYSSARSKKIQSNEAKELHDKTERKENTQEAAVDDNKETPAPQSYSYYSCPPVMQGLGKVKSCNLSSDAAAVYSTPENGECSECMMNNPQL